MNLRLFLPSDDFHVISISQHAEIHVTQESLLLSCPLGGGSGGNHKGRGFEPATGAFPLLPPPPPDESQTKSLGLRDLIPCDIAAGGRGWLGGGRGSGGEEGKKRRRKQAPALDAGVN